MRSQVQNGSAHCRDMPPGTPPTPHTYHPSTHIPRGHPYAALLVPKLPISRVLGGLHASCVSKMAENRLKPLV